MGGPNYNKLKTNLRLSMSRLKLMGKKKTEQAQKVSVLVSIPIEKRGTEDGPMNLPFDVREYSSVRFRWGLQDLS